MLIIPKEALERALSWLRMKVRRTTGKRKNMIIETYEI